MSTSSGRKNRGLSKIGHSRRQDPQGLIEPPWARVRKVPLFRREVREFLSPEAIHVLFEHAEIVVEGGEERGERDAVQRRVFATVMVTLDLTRCAPLLREPADEATTRRVAELIETAPEAQPRLRTLAARELARVAGLEPESLKVMVEIGVRVEGTAVLVDLDAMGTLVGT